MSIWLPADQIEPQNVDLISRLEERGRFLNDQADNQSDDPEEGPDKTADLSTASWTVVSPNVRTQKTMTADFGPAGTLFVDQIHARLAGTKLGDFLLQRMPRVEAAYRPLRLSLPPSGPPARRCTER